MIRWRDGIVEVMVVDGTKPMSMAGQTALVTGASSGIGAAFADALARRNANLVLVARSTQVLEQTARRLRAEHGVRVDVLTCDLVADRAVASLCAQLDALGISVDVLINNAGFATQGRFETIPAERDRDQVLLNVLAVVELCHALAPAMAARGTGAIVNLASTGGFQPAPYLAVYGASKAFVLSFSQALSGELRGRGIRVLALCPGPVDTAFFEVLGSRDAAIGQHLSADVVVDKALTALARGRSVIVPGWRNALTARLVRLLPQSVALALAERAARSVVT